MNKYKSDNDEEIYLIILLLRNILEKKIINIEDIISENNKNEELNPLDYKLLFSIPILNILWYYNINFRFCK